MKRLTPLVAGLAAALIVALTATTPGMADTPPRQIAMGVSEPTWYDVNSVDTVTAELGGHQPAIWSVWSDWGDTGDTAHPGTGPFANIQPVIDGLSAKGIVPQVYWEPLDPSNPTDCAHWSLQNIINGDHDPYIQAWAQAAATDGSPIILRFAHEMNGNWYIWGNGRCTNNSKKFRQAWRHVWAIFHAAGATNVKFEYSIINTQYVTSDYPGNAYVDYLGLTALDWGVSRRPWRSLVQLMSPAMTALRKDSKTKPVIVGEIGANYRPKCSSCDKSAFFSTGYPAAVAQWPQIVAMVYFDYNLPSEPKSPDWRLTSPPAALDAYKALLDNGTTGNPTEFQGTFPQ